MSDSRKAVQMPSVIAITGPTASGKSDFALEFARCLRDKRGIAAEIVSCDSVQVYRGFDIGSAKPTVAERAEFPHHMIDVVAWNEDFDAGTYATMARRVMSDIRGRGALPVIVGGTGLYLRALLGQGFDENLPKDDELRRTLDAMDTARLFEELKQTDPVRASQLHPNDRVRILRAVELCRLLGGPVSSGMIAPGGVTAQLTPERLATLLVFLNPERPLLHERIAKRCEAMITCGLIEEVRGLMVQGCPANAKPMQAIGYREAAAALLGAGGEVSRVDRADLAREITIATRQYAKRQITWFKGAGPDRTVTSLSDYKSGIAGLCALEYDLG